MSHGKLRQEKNCLNCGHTVEERYCPHCGQENTESRQPFHYLFSHFFEDFTHYDGQFWKTLKYLLFFPGKLTRIYITGKRQQFVPPVKLYIFISFVTFFIASFLGINHNKEKDHNEDSYTIETLQNDFKEKNALKELTKTQKTSEKDSDIGEVANLAEYDSLTIKNNSLAQKIIRPYAKKFFEWKDNNVPVNEIIQGFLMVFMHTFPKALFFYLPLFAFILYIFHNKKKWWYFDHGVFTLHYFSFLLFVTAFFLILNLLEPTLEHHSWFATLSTWLYSIAFIYIAIYFFLAHHRFYATRRRRSIFVGIIVFIINSIAFSFLLLILASISLLLIH